LDIATRPPRHPTPDPVGPMHSACPSHSPDVTDAHAPHARLAPGSHPPDSGRPPQHNTMEASPCGVAIDSTRCRYGGARNHRRPDGRLPRWVSPGPRRGTAGPEVVCVMGPSRGRVPRRWVPDSGRHGAVRGRRELWHKHTGYGTGRGPLSGHKRYIHSMYIVHTVVVLVPCPDAEFSCASLCGLAPGARLRPASARRPSQETGTWTQESTSLYCCLSLRTRPVASFSFGGRDG